MQRPRRVGLRAFPLLSLDEIENSPSRRDGVSAAAEAKRRRLTACQLFVVAHDQLEMSVAAWAYAVTFFVRFYARKSMQKNNTFIIAAASLYLASKANDEPRHVRDVTSKLLRQWYMPESLAARAHAPAFLPDLCAQVLEAERALLYTVGFDFSVEALLYTWGGKLLSLPYFPDSLRESGTAFHAWVASITKEVYRRDATLLLQYPPRHIAMAIFYFVFKRAKASAAADIPQPEAGPGGAPWYVAEGLLVAECAAICERFIALFSTKQQAANGSAASRPAPAAALGRAASAAISELAEGELVPGLSGSPASGDPSPNGVDSTATGLATPPVVGAKRQQPGPPEPADGSKRLRLEQQQRRHLTPKESVCRPPVAPRQQQLQLPAAQQACAPPQQQPQSGDESEREEGELEEGELVL